MTQVNVVVQQPMMGGVGDRNLLVGSVHGHRDWTSGLFGCCQDCCGACKVLCAMDCVIFSIMSRIGECPCVHYVAPGALITMRTRIRTLGGIQGSMFNDCMVMSCCCWCAVCQMERELNAMGL